MGISFHIGAVVLAAGLVAVAFFAYRRTTPSVTGATRVALVVLRCLAFVFLVLLLLDPRYAFESSRTEPAQVIALVDRSASMSLPAEGWDAGAPQTRFALAEETAEELRDLVHRRGARFSKVYFSGEGTEGDADTVRANGQGTDIQRALAELARTREGENIAALVVMSDGAETVQRLISPPPLDLPVFTVGVGDTNPPEDVRIQDLDYASLVRAPSRSTIRATIHYSGATSRSVQVRLLEDGRSIFAIDTVLSAEVRELNAEIPVEFPDEGRRRFGLEARVDGEDIELANNRRDIVVDAEKAGVRILIVDLLPEWELHFLTDFLRNDETFDFDVVSSVGAMARDDGRVLAPGDVAGRLHEYDAVVLLSVSDEFMDRSMADALARYVLDEGKGLLVLPGSSSLFERESAWGRLRDVLPVRGSPPPRFRLQYTSVRPGDQAGTNPITAQLLPLFSQREWQERAPLLGYYAPLIPKPDVEVLLEVDERRGPAFVYQNVGKGRVALVGVGPLWRWKFLVDGHALYDEMIARLLDVLSRGESSERFMLMARKNVYDSGESPVITAEIFNEKMQPVTGVPVTVEIARVEEGGLEIPLRIVSMKREGSDNTRFKTGLPALPPGTYRLRGEAEFDGRTLTSQPAELTVSDVSVEYRRVSQDRRNLVTMASQTGGAYATPSGVEAMATQIRLAERTTPTRAEVSLRTNAIAFAALILLLVGEWLLRKRAGMI